MVFDPSQFQVNGFHEIFIAEVGTAFPTSVADDPAGSGWTQLGLTTEAGARFTYDRTITQIFSSQRFDPQRVLVTKLPKKVEYDLQQWTEEGMDLAFGGLTFTTPTVGETKAEPKDASFVNEKALLLRAVDGDTVIEVGYRRTINSKALAFTWAKTAESALPIGSEVLGATNEQPYYLQTNAVLTGS